MSERDPEGALPVDVAAEKAIIAALLTSPAAFDDVAEHLRPEDFHHPGLGAAYEAILACEASGRPFDPVTVADELRRAGKLTKVKGVEGLNRIAASASEVSNLAAYVEIVEGAAKLRNVVVAGRSMVAAASASDADPAQVLTDAEAAVFELGSKRAAGTLVPMAQSVPQVLAEIAQSRDRLLLGESTGFAELDRMTAGLQPGQLVVLAARPAMGKSALALQVARHVAEVSGKTTAFLSYEMSSNELTGRLLNASLGVNLRQMANKGSMPAGFDRDLALAAERLASVPLHIDDRPPETIAGVRSAMRRFARRTNLGLLVVDYLQLMESDRRGRENRNDEVSDISRGLKRLADELGIPIIALSQLNRALEQRANKRPCLSDLRDSGSIEQDASMVWFIFREAVYNAAADPRASELIIAKQRAGSTGTVYLNFEGAATRFSDTKNPATVGYANEGGRGGGGFGGGGNAPF